MNDHEYSARWRSLAAQLAELERSAGIGPAASYLRDATAIAPGASADTTLGRDAAGHREGPSVVPVEASRRQALRMLYFGVSHPALRRSLIAKHRELELFERTGTRLRLEDARRSLDMVRRRPSEGWWIAAIVGATLVIVGYWLFALAGAIAGGVAALFVGNGIEQAARRRFEHAVTFADEEMVAAENAVVEGSSELFSERESAAGQMDQTSEVGDELRAKTL